MLTRPDIMRPRPRPMPGPSRLETGLDAETTRFKTYHPCRQPDISLRHETTEPERCACLQLSSVRCVHSYGGMAAG